MNPCALLIFARRPQAGQVKTRLSPPLPPADAAELYRCMLHDTLNRTRSLAGIDRFVCYVDDDGAEAYFRDAAPDCRLLSQNGTDLGERMAEAFRHLFETGYDRAAIIGSDSPDLPMRFVTESLAHLASGADAVYVPSGDGGFCLLALRKLHGNLFEGIAWSTEKVLEMSLERAANAGLRVELLPVWHDVDTIADLHRPELLDETNGAVLTRAFIRNRGLSRTF